MAIVQMQKLSLCARKQNRKAILERLQNLGVMQIDNSFLPEEGLSNMDTRSAIASFEKNADMLDSTLSVLKAHANIKTSNGMFSGPDQISESRFNDIVDHQQRIMREAGAVLDNSKAIEDCKGTIVKDQNRIISLSPWMELDIPMDFKGTRSSQVFMGSAQGSFTEQELFEDITKGMEDPAVESHIISSVNGTTNVAVVCLKKDAAVVEANLRAAGFVRPAGDEKGVPRQTIQELRADVEKQDKAIKTLSEKIASSAYMADEFKIASDYYRTRAEKYRVLATIPQSENMFFLEGWVEASKADAVTKLLETKYDALVEKEEKKDQEMEPTLLQNNKFARNAEGVLESYGLPQHGRADPTFIMSIFYVFFFGMMLSDAGYGLVMSIGCAVLIHKHKDMPEGMSKMLRLFFWCGLSTVFWGVMYGSFFGDAVDVIAKTFFGYTGDTIVKPLWFEPLSDPMQLLVYCMLFGVIHLFAGLGVKGYELLKGRDYIGFVADILAWYMLITGLILLLLPTDLFASLAGRSFTLPSWMHTFSGILALVGAIIILLFSGRDHKNWAVRIALGAYDLYGATSWLSDILSYSRLLALGLATGVIASVINMMASMGGNSIGGAILFVIVFVAGHLLNIGINALGAYVHTNRLQYVEFFGKFYDAGGRKFEPFKSVSQYVQIKEEN